MKSSLLVEFASDVQLLAAARHMRALGYGDLEAYSPFPVAGIDEALGAPRSRIPLAVLIGGLTGLAASYAIEWGATVAYPLRVGGFPLNSLPAFIPIMFETTILAGALTAFCAVFVRSGLLQWWHPLDEIEGFERSVIDRFFLTVPCDGREGRSCVRCRVDLAACHPLRVVPLGQP
jgi:hypothetical protein